MLYDTTITTYKNGKKRKHKVNAIVTEMGKIDLFEISKKCGCFSEESCRFFFRQLLSGLNHCHKRKVAHGDLKLENVIFDLAGNMKLIDFGLSHTIKN